MSLLDKASLVQIPSGYKSTKLYSVKPINGNGDFTFARSSSATRVNSEGLIEVASVLGSELVVNGDFATDTAWTKGSGWTISGGSANQDNSTPNSGDLTQSNVTTSGKKYKVTFDLVVTSGTISALVGGHNLFTTSGTKTFIKTATSSNLTFRNYSNFIGSIDNVSVKEVIENDVPRLDYSGGASCASLLLEGQSTNLVLHSNDLTQSIWTKSNVSAVSESDGIYNDKNKITINTANDRHIVYQAISKTSANDVFSVYVKKGNTSLVFIQAATNNASSRRGVIFNFDSGAVVNDSIGGAAASYSVDACANGWFRISVKGGLSTTVYPLVGFTNSQNPTLNANYEPIFIGNGTDFFYSSAFQYEVGAYKTSYIPTTSSTVTRTADVCNNAGTSATFNDSEGVLFAEIAALYDDSSIKAISINNGTASERVMFYYISSIITFNVTNSGVSQLSYNYNSSNVKTKIKVALKYKANDFSVFVDGNKVHEDLNGSVPTGLNNLSFDKGDGTLDFYGNTKQLMTFNEALSDEELSDLTGQVNLSFNNLATFYNYTIL